MRLSALAATVEQLTATRSRVKIIECIAAVLHDAAEHDRAPIVYLLQAQLRPPYEGVEVGVGEKLLVRVLASAYATSEATIARRLRTAGDLGLVAESLASQQPRTRMTLRRAYDTLLDVAQMAGPSSVERKVSCLADLLRSVSAQEAKILVRVVQGRLRLGVGDQSILEAAALGAFGDRKKRTLLEHAYNIRADLGSVVDLAFRDGARTLAAVTPVVGVPVRPALAQRLSSARAIMDRLGEVQVEPKYDGFRLQLHRDGSRVWIFSRRLEDVTAMFPELVAAARRQFTAKRVIVEGEAIAYAPKTGVFLPFQITMTRKRKRQITEMAGRYPLRLFAFDLLYAGRTSYLAKAQHDRSRALARIIRVTPDAPIAVTKTIVTARVATLEHTFNDMLHRGLEGVIAKRLDAPYQAGARGYAWVKLKRAYQSEMRDTVDLVLVGYFRGRGKRAALGMGSLLGAVYDPVHDRFRTVAKIGSGLSDAAWTSLQKKLKACAARRQPRRVDSRITPDVWVEPTFVVEVLADEITRSPLHTCGQSGQAPGYALRFPRLVHGIRTDKAASDATTEQEILDLYRLQSRPTRQRSTSSGHARGAKVTSASYA